MSKLTNVMCFVSGQTCSILKEILFKSICAFV